ncbi:MAG: hypothetical protein DRJ38_09350 [Thermoprotei archaeon]|nr:MAG: hypothetical protein DRJ38_09345 [Thermoprotei archaeon]RLE62617.1 MAG: hypothetical protein DRJ38_09350 [Thermoprotei archaeon]
MRVRVEDNLQPDRDTPIVVFEIEGRDPVREVAEALEKHFGVPIFLLTSDEFDQFAPDFEMCLERTFELAKKVGTPIFMYAEVDEHEEKLYIPGGVYTIVSGKLFGSDESLDVFQDD